MSKKIKYEIQFIPYKEAVQLFSSADDLQNALKEGSVAAFGDYCPDPSKEPTGRQHIPSWCWRNYKLSSDSLFGGVDEYGSDDPEEYRNITLEKASIEKLKVVPVGSRGAPPKYDWDSFWRAVAYHLYIAAQEDDDSDIDMPVSLRDWAGNVSTDYSYVWLDGAVASETLLEDKLRPLWKAVQDKSDKSLRAAVAAKTNAGNK